MSTRKHLGRSLTGVLAALAVLLAGAGQAMAQFCFGEPENLGPPVNTAYLERAPGISADGLTLFFASTRTSGLGGNDLWVTTRPSHSDPWEDPVNLGPTVNSSDADGAPNISADGLTLFFHSTRSGGEGYVDLWMTTRASELDPWEPPVNLGPTVNSSDWDGGPSIFADELTLFFDSDRPGGFGDRDLWMTTRASISDPWEPPVNLGPTVNSSDGDATPSISADGLTLFFSSHRPGGQGLGDLWATTRASLSDPWEPPRNLGPVVNTSGDDLSPDISADGLTLFFYSGRSGGYGGYDLWQVAVTPTWPGDLDCDGDVDLSDLATLLAHYGMTSGATWGDGDLDADGDVDLADLAALLASYGVGT
jgi:Tol biopolymer transport system component